MLSKLDMSQIFGMVKCITVCLGTKNGQKKMWDCYSKEKLEEIWDLIGQPPVHEFPVKDLIKKKVEQLQIYRQLKAKML